MELPCCGYKLYAYHFPCVITKPRVEIDIGTSVYLYLNSFELKTFSKTPGQVLLSCSFSRNYRSTEVELQLLEFSIKMILTRKEKGDSGRCGNR